jgi:hypothetical protein
MFFCPVLLDFAAIWIADARITPTSEPNASALYAMIIASISPPIYLNFL